MEKLLAKAMKKEPDPLLIKIAEKYKEIYLKQAELERHLHEFETAHNEMMGLVIGVVRQHGGEMLLKKEYMPQLDVREYRIKWVDVPEEEGIRLEVKHFTDN